MPRSAQIVLNRSSPKPARADSPTHGGGGRDRRTLALATGLVIAFGWSYWPTLEGLWRTWQINPDYSAGQLVPVVAGWVVWRDRKALAGIPRQICWWGLPLLLLSQLTRLAGALMSYGSLEQYSLVVAVPGVLLLVFGSRLTARLVWVLLFLLLLVPFPRRIHSAIVLPLQQFATTSAVVCLETLGYLVLREGNVLHLSQDRSVAVAEACSGLRMLTAFLVVGATFAFVVQQPRWQKVVLMLSTIPLGVMANTLRVAATAIAADYFASEKVDVLFHDYAGIMMMPFAFAGLIGVLHLMNLLEGERAPDEILSTAARTNSAQ